jgi:O-antigen/teichoic acid export membrane protein
MILMTGFSVVSALGVEGAATRKYYDHDLAPVDIAQFVGSCIWILVITSIVLAVASAVLQQTTMIFQSIGLAWVLYGVFSGGCVMLMQFTLGQAQVRERASLFAIIQILSGLSNLGISLFFVISLRLGAEGRVLGIVLSSMVTLVVCSVLLIRTGWLDLRWRSEFIKEALTFGVPLIPHSVALFALAMADRYLIGTLIGFKELGVYVLAMQVAAVFSIFFTAFHNAFTPWLFNQLKTGDSSAKQAIVMLTYSYFLFFLAVAAIASSIGPSVISILAGEEYVAANDFVALLIFSQIFIGFYLMLVGYLLFEKKTKLLSFITVSSASLNILLILLLIPYFGLKGVAIASLVAMIIRFFAIWIASMKVHPMPWFRKFW